MNPESSTNIQSKDQIAQTGIFESKAIPVASVSPEATTVVAVVPDAEFAGTSETIELESASVVTQMFELLSRAMANGLATL
jgi:hypothetical protein